MLDTQILYNELVDAGIKKEDARYILPNACHTEIVFTMNFRALRNFIKLRTDKHAQEEIRVLANAVLKILMDYAPRVFGDLL